MMSVVAQRIGKRQRQMRAQRRLLVDEAAVCPPTGTANGASTARTARTKSFAAALSGVPGAIRSMRARGDPRRRDGAGSRAA